MAEDTKEDLETVLTMVRDYQKELRGKGLTLSDKSMENMAKLESKIEVCIEKLGKLYRSHK